MIRVLGKGLTAKAIKDSFNDVVLYDDTNFKDYDLNSDEVTIVSPGIPPYNDMVKSANNIQSDYDLVYDQMPFSVWVSGTNGKTTVTQMIQHILEEKGSVCGGNIGIPVTSLDKKANIWILETSSFTFHYTKRAKPNLYILLPITEDHITWHGSYEEYKKAKLKPLTMMGKEDIAIIPEEFKDFPTLAKKIIYKNSDDLCKYFNIDKKSIKFREPFLLDAILSLAVKKILFDQIDYNTINSYRVDKHKLEEFFDANNRLWVDDSKATNVDATIKALESYKDKQIFLILGGDDKGVDLQPLFKYIQSMDIEIFAIGTNEDRLIEYCEKFNIKNKRCSNLKKAVDEISLKHHKNAVAMLSPAASSLDQYSSYKQRGEKFKNFVFTLSLN